MIDLKRRTFIGFLSTGVASAFVYFRTRQVMVTEMLKRDMPTELRKHPVLFLTPEAKSWADRRGVEGFQVTESQAKHLWSMAAKRKVVDGRTN